MTEEFHYYSIDCFTTVHHETLVLQHTQKELHLDEMTVLCSLKEE